MKVFYAIWMRVYLTNQTALQLMEENPCGGGHLDRYKNLKVFDGNPKDFEEWNVKFQSLINAGNPKVGRLLKAVEHEFRGRTGQERV